VAYNSVANKTGFWAENAVQVAYDKIFNWKFNAESLLVPLVDVKPQQVTAPGSSITMFINQFFDDAAIAASLTPLNEEADVTPDAMPASTSVTLTPTEYGKAVAATEKLNGRTLTPVNPVMAATVAEHCKNTLDRLVETQLRTATGTVYAGSATSAGTVTNSDKVTATLIRRQVTKLNAASVPTRGAGAYLGIFHPDQIHDLREETGSGSWRVPNEYGSSQDKIWNGEFGLFEGVRFISNPRSLWTADKQAGADKDGAGAGTDNYSVYHGYILGAEALAKAEVTAPQTVVSPVVDRLKRFYGLGWKADLDYKIYRQESVRHIVSGSSVGE
jgi:N4-gp56 family major capsid protein